MPVVIEADTAGQIWRIVDGLSRERLVLCTPAEAEAQGLVRYGDAYPGERWQTPGSAIRPEHVPQLYLAPVEPPMSWRVSGDAMEPQVLVTEDTVGIQTLKDA